MMADLHLPIRPRSDLALHQRPDPRRHRARPGRPRLHRARTPPASTRCASRSRDYTPERVAEITGLAPELIVPDRLALRQRARRVHRLDDGREPQHQGHRDGQRHQQPGAHHRQHRPRGRGAVLDHRPVQRDGHARGRLRLEPARLPQVRERGRPRGAGGALERAGRADSRRRAASPIPTSSRRRSTGAIRALWIIATNPIVSFPEPRRAAAGARGARVPGRAGRLSTRRRPPSSPHLVLPAAIWGEKEGTYTNSERRVSKVNRAVRAAGRGALRLRHLPRPRRRARRARRAVSRAGRRPATRSRSGSASRRAGSATTRA